MTKIIPKTTPFTWHAEVRGYELDLQGIVNNAVYLQYFDHARVSYLMSKGIDWEIWHHQGYNFVVHHVDLHFKRSLRQHDQFYVTATVEKQGRLKVVFHQSIYRIDNTLIATAITTCVCVSTSTNKPAAPSEFMRLLFS
jgi:acyl-CoA thioester hydrolase